MSAKYYIYRNLNKGGFSVRLRGLVVDYIEDECICMGVSFNVSEKGRQRAIKKGQRNVHAFIVCENYVKGNGRMACAFGTYPVEVTYRPFEYDFFYRLDNGKDIYETVLCHLKDNTVFVR